MCLAASLRVIPKRCFSLISHLVCFRFADAALSRRRILLVPSIRTMVCPYKVAVALITVAFAALVAFAVNKSVCVFCMCFFGGAECE
jgi:hypothetical protein